MTTTTNSSTTEVTLATISADLRALTAEVRQMREDIRNRLDNHEIRLREQEHTVARLDERLKATTGLLGILSVVGNALAAWFGINR